MEILVTSNNNKMTILKNSTSLEERRFFTLKDFKDKILGKLDQKALYYIYQNYHYNIPYVLNLAKYLPYINEDIKYNSLKLEELKNIKIDLISKNYFNKDLLFLKYLKRVDLKFYDLLPSKENELILAILQENDIKYEVINLNLADKTYQINLAKDEQEELYFVFLQIGRLLQEGIKPSQIHLVNVSNNYYPLLKRLSYFFKVDIALKSLSSLIDKKEVNDFLLGLNNLSDAAINIKDDVLRKTIINLINKYDLTKIKDTSFLKEFFIYFLRNTTYQNNNYSEAIKLSSLTDYFSDTDYVFLVNFNQNFPALSRENFLTSEETNELGLSPDSLKNDLKRKEALIKLSRIKNLVITRPKTCLSEENFSSILEEEMKFSTNQISLELGQNKLLDDIVLTSLLDNLANYNVSNEVLDKYDTSHLNYQGYDNRFIPFKMPLKDNINISYTSLDTYFNCAFHYYLDYILGLSDYEDTIYTLLGTYVHGILEKSYKPGFDFAEEIAEAKKDMTPKVRFFASRYDIVLKRLINFNQFFEEKMKLNNVKTEEKIEIKHDFLTLKGFIDKLRYLEENDKIYLAVYDYKTGQYTPSLDNLNYGFNMQLPTYLYLLSNKFSDKAVEVCGLFIQKVTLDTLKEEDENKQYTPFRLLGFSNVSLLDYLDPNYQESEYIKGLRVKKDGNFDSKAKLIDNDDIKQIMELVEANLKKVEEAYLNSDFKINPKIISNKLNACTNCPYSNICYKKYQDEVYLEDVPFKGDEKNGVDK